MQRVFFILYLCCFILWPVLSNAQQKTNIKYKVGLEAGSISTDFLDNGFLARSFLKINIKKKFTESLLKINSRLNPEILNTGEIITGYKVFLELEYLLTQSVKNSIYFNLNGKNQIHFLEQARQQVFNELESRILISHKFSSKFIMDFQHSLFFRKINTDHWTSLKKNNIESALIINTSQNSTFRIGLFWEYVIFSYLQNNHSYNNRIGPLLEYSYTKNMIFKTNYKLDLDTQDQFDTQWISILCGKYLGSRISVFIFLYYLWQTNDQQKAEDLIFYQLEAFNNFTFKIGYDLSPTDNLYFKIVYENQEIFRDGLTLSYWQGIIGFQKTF